MYTHSSEKEGDPLNDENTDSSKHEYVLENMNIYLSTCIRIYMIIYIYLIYIYYIYIYIFITQKYIHMYTHSSEKG